MRKSLAIAAAVLVVLAAAGFFVWHRAGQELQAGLAAFQASLPTGSTMSYASARPDLLSRGAHLTNVKIIAGAATYSAATVDVAPAGDDRLRRLTLHDATEQAPGTTVSAGLVEASGVSQPGGPGAIAAKAVAIDHLAVHDVRFANASNDRLTIGDTTLDDYGGGRRSSLSLRNVDVQATGVSFDRFTADRLQVSGIDLAGLLPPSESLGPRAFHRVSAQWSGLAIVAHGKKLVTLSALDLRSQPQGSDKVSTHLNLSDLIVLADDQVTPGLQQLGYDKVRASLQADLGLDRDARTLRLDDLDLKLADMGRLRLALALDNLPPDLLNPHPGTSTLQLGLSELVGLQLRSLAFGYEDQGLLAKLKAEAAARQHVTPAQITAAAQDRVRALATQYGVPDAAIGPVLMFLADPHGLRIAMQPPQPVPVLGIPSLLARAPDQSLGLRVTNEIPEQ